MISNFSLLLCLALWLWKQCEGRAQPPIVLLPLRSATATAPHWFLYYCSSHDDISHFVSSAFFFPLISIADYSASVGSDLMREPTELLLPSFTVIALRPVPAGRLRLHAERQIISTEEATILTHQQKAVTDRGQYKHATVHKDRHVTCYNAPIFITFVYNDWEKC